MLGRSLISTRPLRPITLTPTTKTQKFTVRGHSSIRVMNLIVHDNNFFFVCMLDLVILFCFCAFGAVIQDKSVSQLFIHSYHAVSGHYAGSGSFVTLKVLTLVIL